MPLILFDIDCTLLLTGGAGREATRLAMEEIFGTASGIEKHDFGGKTDWQTLVELLREHGYDVNRVGEFMAAYQVAMARHLEAIIDRYPVRALPGAIALVQTLRDKRVPLGVVTGNVSTTAPIKLRRAGFDPAWFPVGAYGSEAHSRDELPPIALERAIHVYHRHFQPDEVIVVGDTPMDIACARALGAVAVAVETGFCGRDALINADPDYVLPDLTTFLDAVRVV